MTAPFRNPTQVLPSRSAEEAIDVLNELLKARAPETINDGYFTRDWSDLWEELAASEWTTFADGPAPGESGEFSLLDLSALAETWGSYLIPLPFIPTLVVRRWIGVRPGPSTKLSYVAPEGALRLVPYGDQARQVLSGSGLHAYAAEGGSLDQFAPSHSIAISHDAALAAASPGMRQEAAILAAAEAVGAASRLLSMTVEYVKMREQFGKPVGSFQAIKHLLANLHVRVELARSAVVWAICEPAAVRPATLAILEHCLRVTEGCIQAHGGVGYTWEAPPHRYCRHVMSLRRVVVTAGHDAVIAS